MERATRADVARAAGVAPSTVSLVLNGRGRDVKIAPATIDRVKAAARELNYIPNAAARSLRRGKSHLIALLMAELPDDPFVPVVHTVLTTAMIDIQQRGYLLLPLFQSGDGASDAEVIRGVWATRSSQASSARPPPPRPSPPASSPTSGSPSSPCP